MSSDEQPAEEPRTLHYRRTDPDKEPTTPAGQQAAMEGMQAAHGYGPAENLRDQIMGLIVQHERETVAARALAGDPNPTDADELDYVRDLAEQYDRARDDPEAMRAFLARFRDELSLDDVRVLRIAGEAATAATPHMIEDAADRGMKPKRIAAELSVSESYVYRVLREQRAAEADQDQDHGQ